MTTPDLPVSVPETYTIPVGPLHVALEEPMYFKIDVRGETVNAVDINAGHVHRGIEYLATHRSITQTVVLTERSWYGTLSVLPPVPDIRPAPVVLLLDGLSPM